jgi:hypothetical protein
MDITDKFQNDVKKVIEKLPIERLNKKGGSEELNSSKKKEKKLQKLIRIIGDNCNKRSKLEKSSMKLWALVSIIVFCIGFGFRYFNIHGLIPSVVGLVYFFFSSVIVYIIGFSSIFGRHQKAQSKAFEINFIFKKSCHLYEVSSEIAMLDFESNDNSIKAVKEVLINKLNRQKSIEKISSDVTYIYVAFVIFMFYIFYGNGIFIFIKTLNSNNLQGIFGGSFFALVVFIVRLFFNFKVQSEISTLEFCVSVLENAEFLRKEKIQKSEAEQLP